MDAKKLLNKIADKLEKDYGLTFNKKSKNGIPYLRFDDEDTFLDVLVRPYENDIVIQAYNDEDFTNIVYSNLDQVTRGIVELLK